MIEDTLEHVEQEHLDEAKETYPGLDPYFAVQNYHEKDHDPSDHDHSCMPRTGEVY